MSIKKGFVITGLTGVLVFGGVTSAFAATDYDLTQSYADSVKGASYETVVNTLGEPDHVEEVDMDELGTIISATWSDGDYDTLLVTTGADGKTIETVIFSESGDLEDYTTVDADLEAAYHNIESGMSYDEVVAIIGAEGTLGASSKGSFGEDITSTSSVYSWTTDDFNILSIAFSDDGMVAKSLITSSGEVLTDYADGSVSSEGSSEESQSNDNTSNEQDETEETTNSDNESSEDETTESSTDNNEEGTTEKQNNNAEAPKEEATEDVKEEPASETETSVEQQTEEENVQVVQEDENKEEQQGGKLPDTNAGIPLGFLGGLAATAIGAFGLRRKN